MKPEFIMHDGGFYIKNYNHAAPFASFFPGMAGETGKPMWVFYTNRGQGISSFGINNKDGSMLEFLPANKAYQATPSLGFRTFIKVRGKNKDWFEPFCVLDKQSPQQMAVRPYELEFREKNSESGLEIEVVYFGVPTETHAVLARSLTVKNITNKPIQVEIIDGLPRVVPFGMNDYLVKHMSRTIEAFAEVLNAESRVPFFKLKIEPSDRPEIKWFKSGFFSFCLNNSEFLPVAVDPASVFGQDTTFSSPAISSFDSSSFDLKNQMKSNILPSSFFGAVKNIKPNSSVVFQSYFGHAEDMTMAGQFALKVKSREDYFSFKRNEMAKIYSDLIKQFGFQSSNETLNSYAQANFMDNVLRGGLPVSFGAEGPILHVYSRKHGDMERDYNSFQISATPYSQGNGNFRDVNQNRRHDLMINPKVGSINVEFFFNLLQLDGYNPLVINPMKLKVPRDFLNHMDFKMSEACNHDYHALTREPVQAGKIFEFVSIYANDPLNVNNLFRRIVSSCKTVQGVQHEEGFWVDHWTYNLDHLDQYFMVFPEKKKWLLYEKNDFTFYDSDHFVRPRKEKYVITKEGELRQYNAVMLNESKKELIGSRDEFPHLVRIENGQGEIFKTNLFIKLLALASIKTATLDPEGVGIEMEANKPGWCDALNGCPALFGSSTHEMFELHRLIKFLLDEAIPLSPNKSIELPYEIYTLIRDIDSAISDHSGSPSKIIWDKLATARETFREHVFFGLSGKMRPLRMIELGKILERVSHLLDGASRKAIDSKTSLPTSYFTYSVDAHKLHEGWRQNFHKFEWKQHRIVPFLEGVVHAMKLSPENKSRRLYSAVKKSQLADKKLGMYKLNAPLTEESTEIGRIKVFSPGWLENESIFLHMHYKYLLEILRSGLIKEFILEIKEGLIPFRKQSQYGRPIFENSSFLASSQFPNKEVHGKGFVARLSGATIEFMSMVYYLVLGKNSFKEVEGGVVFSPQPSLPTDWFSKETTENLPKHGFGIRLFGVPVLFLNPNGKEAFGSRRAQAKEFEWILEGRFHQSKGDSLPLEASVALREGRLESLSITLG